MCGFSRHNVHASVLSGLCAILIHFEHLDVLFRVLTIIFSPQIVEEHCSVEQSRRAQAEPISLDSCLKAFTSEEELGEDELYYCSKCKTHRLATKKLDLWRLPPILVSLTLGFEFGNCKVQERQ